MCIIKWNYLQEYYLFFEKANNIFVCSDGTTWFKVESNIKIIGTL